MSLHKRDLQEEIIYRTGYTPCPNELFEALKGEPIAFMVWMYIFKQSETWNPSYTKMASDLDLSRNAVIKAVKILEERKLLVVHSGGQFNGLNETNKYELLPIKQWNLSRKICGSPQNEGGVVQNMHYPGLPQNEGGVVQNMHQGVVHKKDWNKDKEEKDKQEAGEKILLEKNLDNKTVTCGYSITTATEVAKQLKESNKDLFPEVKPSVREVLRSWKRVLPDRPSFDSRLSLLEDLFATLKKFSYSEEDLPRNFKEESLSPWIGPKSKEYAIKYSNEDYDKALSILSPEIQIVSADPVKQKMKIRSSSSSNIGDMDIETALEMVTEDDEVQRIIAAHKKLLRGEDNE